MTKLALVLGGHASLGAYSAGAATEILTALEGNRRGDPVTVGVVTGAGLGALSAAVAARSLAVNVHLVPWIERLWVDALDARHLLPEGPAPGSAVLDPKPLEELTAQMVDGPPADDDRPSEAIAGELRLGIDLPGGEADVATTGRPAAVFGLGPATAAADPVWDEVRRAVLDASSAPLALSPRRPVRGAAGARPREGAPGPVGPPDGGTDRPRPLALARRLMRGGRDPDGGTWRVVVLDPGADPDGPGRAGSLLGAAGRLLRAGMRDDLAHDWRAAGDAAERTGLLRSLVNRLPEIHGRLDDPDAVGLGRRIGELAERVAERDVRRFGPAEDDRTGDPALRRLDDSLRRIQAHPAYAPIFRDVDSRAGKTRLAKLVYVLEAVGDLHGTDPARLHRVAPDAPGSLAGRGLAGYGGFAARAWRRHDWVAGRRDARRVLEGPLSDVIDYEPDGPDAYDPPSVPALDGALDRRGRGRLRRRLGALAGRFLDEMAPGGFRGLLYRIARPGLRRTAAGRLMEAMEAGAAG